MAIRGGAAVRLRVGGVASTRAGPSGHGAPVLRAIALVAALCATSFTAPSPAAAQGVSTGTIRGTVRTEGGAAVEGALVRVLNTATGVSLTTRTARGRFLAHGLEVGGPYVVEVRGIGFLPQRSAPLPVTLGEPLDVEFVLEAAATQLERVQVTAPAASATVHAGGGTATIVTDSLLNRLPTLNRSFLDFVQLSPQVSTKIGSQRNGMSAAGANLRFNTYLVNGADARIVNSNMSAGDIPIDAVREYQVLVAPYDVRYGDFAGAVVNTVTQSGTNQLRGSAFAYWRDNRLARGGARAPDSLRYERWQYGFSLGGPILRDRLHFFVAPEIQRRTSPAPGPYLGQPSSSRPTVPVGEADVARFATIMRDRFGLASGSAGSVERENPLRDLFARVDAAIPRWRSRATGFVIYARADADDFSRSSLDTFYLSSARHATANRSRLASLQLRTDLARLGGGHNELLVSRSSLQTEWFPDVRQPLVRVRVPASTGGGSVLLAAGTREQAQAGGRWSGAVSVKDELTLPLGARHVTVLGVHGERFRLQSSGVAGEYGMWTFASLDDLERGVAERYEVRRDLGGAGAALWGGQYAAYAGDEWRAADRLAITLGLRVDLLAWSGHAPYNEAVDSIFGRRTDEMPRPRVHLSPRVGFTWDLSAEGRDQLRGGVGIFTGRPPPAWIQPALSNYAVGIGSLRCGPSGAGAPPTFQPDYRDPPTVCAGGQGPPPGDVDLLARSLRMAQSLRASVAYDRRLPWGVLASAELLTTRYLSDFVFVNLNLVGPQAVDRFGRVLYGTIDSSGVASPATRSDFQEVIDLRNTSRNYTHQLSTRLERRFARGISATASYTYSRTRDVQSPSRIGNRGIVLWGDAGAVSGRHEALTPGISLNDLPHRVVTTLTYDAPWRRWPTGASLYYVGESGSPFTYRATGDLNIDGSAANDPIYVPRSALDASEIRFRQFTRRAESGALDTVTVAAQQAAFERFVDRTACLRRQRGRIVERNSCREPWSHTMIAAVRQAIPFGGRALEAELDAFNVLNLLNRRWGQYRVAEPRLLELAGRSGGSAETAEPVFRFDPSRREWTTLPTESAFQLQLALRYRF